MATRIVVDLHFLLHIYCNTEFIISESKISLFNYDKEAN